LLPLYWACDFSFRIIFFILDNVRVVTTSCAGPPHPIKNDFAAYTRFSYEYRLFVWALEQRWWVFGNTLFRWVIEKILDNADPILVQSPVDLNNAENYVAV
jgi:hypothetical protein